MTRNELKLRAKLIANTNLTGDLLELLIVGLAEEFALDQSLHLEHLMKEKVVADKDPMLTVNKWDKVRCSTLIGGHQSEQNLAQKYLILNKVYMVQRVHVDEYYTNIYLYDFPNIAFNSVFFEKCKPIQDGD